MRQRLIDSALKDKLLLSKDYRKFLKILIESSANTRGEQAKLSRKAGFSSRSYLSELLAGKKGLSRDSASRLKNGLQLSKFWGNYFDCLVWLEHPELCPRNITLEQIKSKITQLRSDIKNLSENNKIEKTVAEHLHRPQVFQVYAALGSETKGASLKEIGERTGLQNPLIEKTLEQLLKSQAVRQLKDRYYAEVSKADALNFSKRNELSELIRLITLDLQKKRESIVASPSSLTVYRFRRRTPRLAAWDISGG